MSGRAVGLAALGVEIAAVAWLVRSVVERTPRRERATRAVAGFGGVVFVFGVCSALVTS